MGGIGKTTLAAKLYNIMLPKFGDAACFLPDLKVHDANLIPGSPTRILTAFYAGAGTLGHGRYWQDDSGCKVVQHYAA